MARIKPLSEVLRGVTRFGRLTVLCEAERIVAPSGFAALAAHVRCDCGTEKVVRARGLLIGHTSSCGCLQRELTAVKIAERSRTHGMAGKGNQAAEYKIWTGMKQRCTNPKMQTYKNYGGKGVRVCDAWMSSFEAFFADMGPRPSPSHQIDRIDGKGHYEPSNCRWATPVEQARNRRSCTSVTAHGRTQTVAAWAEEMGLDAMVIYGRLRKGWSDEKAVTQRKMTLQERSIRANEARWDKLS